MDSERDRTSALSQEGPGARRGWVQGSKVEKGWQILSGIGEVLEVAGGAIY